MTEERIISFDEDVEASSFVILDEGLYQFAYCGYTQGNTNPKDGGQSFPTAIAKLKVRNAVSGEEFDAEEIFIMSSKWQWKLSQFWKSLGAQERQLPNGKKSVPQGWNTMVGQRGYFEVTKSVSTKDASKTYTNKNFIEPEKVQEHCEKWGVAYPGQATTWVQPQAVQPTQTWNQPAQQQSWNQPAQAPAQQTNNWSQGW